jgi:hypothetical protein
VSRLRRLRRRGTSRSTERNAPTAFAVVVVVLLAVVLAAVVIGAVVAAVGDSRGEREAAVSTVASPSTTTVAGSTSTDTTSPVTAPAPTGITPTPTTNPTITTIAPTTGPATPAALVPLTVAPVSHAASYDREAFGGWIDADHDCQNTRAEVLIAESHAAVTYTRAAGCVVATGAWTDPWSGTSTSIAHDFDVDHSVPLANAWRSGAWAWTRTQRVAYANDLDDADHLIAIVAAENRAKGDDGPESWRPPRQSAWCRYALVWDHIKAKWRLSATPEEWRALVEMAATC